MAAPERIILGSGYIHVGLFTKGMIVPNPEDFCTDANKYAYISGGAELSYSSENYEAKDDMGQVAKSIITSEEVTLKSGIMTFSGNTLEVLCDTARVSTRESAVDGKTYREVRVGGTGNQKGDKYVICFHHIDNTDGDIYLMIVGQNQAGFTLSFKKDEATVVDAEFHALPLLDGDGTLVTYTEEVKGSTVTYNVTQNLSHVASSFTGRAVSSGSEFSATLTAAEGYTIGTPVIIMGGEVVADAWTSATGEVEIASVTGDISITATATEN